MTTPKKRYGIFNPRLWLYVEGLFFFLVLPAMLFLEWIPFPWGLFFGFAYILTALFRFRDSLYGIAFGLAGNRGFIRGLPVVLIRFLLCSVILFILVRILAPDRLFSFMKTRPDIYIPVMLFYPLFSVIPQELIFRVFFFYRYRRLFSSEYGWIVGNAIVFSWAHIIFANPIALGSTFLAGLFFAWTYARTRSFYLVCVEHALYGSLVWTVGIGGYFYHPL